MADRLGQDWASNDNSVWLVKFKSSPGHFKWPSRNSAISCLGLFIHSVINFSGIKSCPLLFAITINILIIYRFQTRNIVCHNWQWCPFSNQVPFFARKMRNFGQFWTISAILLRIYALFSVLLQG